jgi:hypothetical protein
VAIHLRLRLGFQGLSDPDMDRAFDIAGLIVVAAIITTIVAHPETKSIVNSFGVAFGNSLVAAEGYGKTQAVPG